VAALGGVWAWVNRVRKQHRERETSRALDAQSVRYLLDAVFHLLSDRVPNDEFTPSPTVMRDQWLLVKQQRGRVAKADGLDFPEEVREYLSRTLRIQARIAKQGESAGDQDMFKPEDLKGE
jgi:hypothetical protein